MGLTGQRLARVLDEFLDEMLERGLTVEVEGVACLLGARYVFRTVAGTAADVPARLAAVRGRLPNGGWDVSGTVDGGFLGVFHTRGANDDGPWRRVPE